MHAGVIFQQNVLQIDHRTIYINSGTTISQIGGLSEQKSERSVSFAIMELSITLKHCRV